MKSVKIVILLLATCLSISSLNAQNVTCEKQSIEVTQLSTGMASVVFESSQPDWVIRQVAKNIAGDEQLAMSTTSVAGKAIYRYEFLADVSRDHERTYILERKGKSFSEQCVAKSLRSGYRVTYKLEELADDLMRIEAQQGSRLGLYPYDGKACVEITTTIEILQVETAWPQEETKSASGARVISVDIDIERMRKLKNSLDSLQKIITRLENASDYEHLEEPMNQQTTKEAEYNSLSQLVIGGNGIKGLPIDLTELSPKSKIRYAVVAISESFEDLLKYARSFNQEYPAHTETSYYDAAKIAYDKVLNHKDIPQDQIEAIRAERDTMASLRRSTYLVEESAKRVSKYETEKGFSCDEVYKYLNGEINFINKILKYHPEITGYQNIKEHAIERLNQHPKAKIKDGEETLTYKRETVRGTISFKSKYRQRPANQIRIYASPTKEIQAGQSRYIGKVKDDYTYEVVKPDGINPLYIYVSGEKDEAHYVPGGDATVDIEVK